MNRLAFGCLLLCTLAPVASAQRSERDSALYLFDKGLHLESKPLLEKLVAAGSKDPAVLGDLGFIVIQGSGASPDATVRKQQRALAHSLFAQAVAAGSKSIQVGVMADGIPADGGDDTIFSSNPAVNDAMTKAEAAYSANDNRTALANYQKALALDPTLYDAALFSGDAYAKLKLPDSAYVWYAQAAAINPNRETAWRYWSDVLLKNNKDELARDKAVEAVVADPYGRLARQGIVNWGLVARESVGFPKINLPAVDTAAVHSAAWIAYDSVRRAWKGPDTRQTPLFIAAYPKDRAYRHSLQEELAAVRAAYRAGNGDAGTINLKKLDDAGLLEAYVFILRPDAGIASEYVPYLAAHRDVLKRFWNEAVIGAKYSN